MSSFSADHRGFYCGEKPFFPIMDSNVALVHLSASLRDDLDWSEEKRRAEQIVTTGKAILWQVDFHIEKIAKQDSAAFFAHARALEAFTVFSSPFLEHTFGVCIYSGSADMSKLFDAAEWEDVDNFHLFSADLLADYLHRLASVLPDGILPFAFFDLTGIASPAFGAQLFSKERFQYLHLGLRGAQFPFIGIGSENTTLPALGIYFPSDSYCSKTVLADIDRQMHSLREDGTPFRILCEERLTEEWDGLDRLIVIPESVSPQGKRKLQGFLAAGGEILNSL